MRLFPCILLAVTSFASLRAEDAKATPTAAELLGRVRQHLVFERPKVTGKLLDNESGKEEPFTLTSTKDAMRMTFANPAQVVTVDRTGSSPKVKETKSGKTTTLPRSQLGEKIRGTDMTYEDLAMPCLYWKNAKVMGEESLGLTTGKAWKVRVSAPDATGPYAHVDIWVHQSSGAMAKLEGLDQDGKKVKMMKVASFQSHSDLPSSLRIETYAPGKGRTGRSYLEFDPAETK